MDKINLNLYTVVVIVWRIKNRNHQWNRYSLYNFEYCILYRNGGYLNKIDGLLLFIMSVNKYYKLVEKFVYAMWLG